MMRPLVSVLVLLACALGMFACGDDPKPGPKPEAATEPLPSPTEPGLFVVGNDLGMIRPCGCSKPLLGGIVRRGAFFAVFPPEIRTRSTVIGVGGMIHEGGRQQELKLEGFMESLQVLGASVVLPNEYDLLVGSRFWTDLLFQRKDGDIPIVAGNILAAGVPLFQKFARIEVLGRSVLVTSWLWPDSGVISEPGVTLDPDPDLADLQQALVDESGKVSDLILYTSAPEPIARAWFEKSGLGKSGGNVLMLVSGPSDLPTIVARSDRFLSVEVGQKGRDVARLGWPLKDDLEHFTLVEAYGDNARQKEILDFYRSNVAHEQLLYNAPKFQMSEGPYSDPESCAACHQEAHRIWKESRHAHAFATLQRVGDDQDPECVRCHVVDFDRLGGFDPVSIEPVNVQCESCHGPSADHVADPTKPTPRGKMTENECRLCHDLANSPYFDFGVYWPKIAHGK